jgi:hypothetical protein
MVLQHIVNVGSKDAYGRRPEPVNHKKVTKRNERQFTNRLPQTNKQMNEATMHIKRTLQTTSFRRRYQTRCMHFIRQKSQYLYAQTDFHSVQNIQQINKTLEHIAISYGSQQRRRIQVNLSNERESKYAIKSRNKACTTES